MQQQAGMDGNLPGFQFKTIRGAVMFDIVHGLVQDIVLLGVAFAVRQQSMTMGCRHYLHASILSVDIVYRHPDGYHLCPVHGLVGKILVPGHYFGIVRQFAKVMGPDGGKIRTEEVFGQIEDLRTCDQVINPAIHHVGTTD